MENSFGRSTLEPAVQEYLKPDSYILRDYANSASGSAVNVFVAYFKSLQSGYGPHSPAVCLPGSGWLVRERTILNISVPGRGAAIPVNKFLLEKAGQHILVLYWYQNDRNVWAEEFQGKLRLLPDLIKYKRSDVSLVRLVQPLRGTTMPVRRSASASSSPSWFFRRSPRISAERTSGRRCMRVVYLNPCGQMGGAEMSLMDVLASMRAAEPTWQFWLVLGEDGPLAGQAKAAGVHVIVAPFPRALARLGDSGGGPLRALWSCFKAAAPEPSATPGICAGRWRN